MAILKTNRLTWKIVRVLGAKVPAHVAATHRLSVLADATLE